MGKRLLVLMLVCVGILAVPATASAQGPPQQCPVVVENTHLEADCIGPMVIAADNVNVNLGRHQVFCLNAPPSFIGILVEDRFRVHIENGHVHNCSGGGIVVRGGGAHHLNNLHLEQNGPAGIAINNSSSNDISASHVSDNAGFGISFFEAENNRVHAGSDVSHNNRGVIFVRSSDNAVTSSALNDNVLGVEILGGSGNFVRSSTINGNDVGVAIENVGFDVATNHTVQGNEIAFNEAFGVRISGASNVQQTGNLIASNKIHDNGDAGISSVFSNRNEFRHNHVTGNRVGIQLGELATAHIVANNTARQNTVFDLEDDNPNCDANVWRNNNNGTQNQPCID